MLCCFFPVSNNKSSPNPWVFYWRLAYITNQVWKFGPNTPAADIQGNAELFLWLRMILEYALKKSVLCSSYEIIQISDGISQQKGNYLKDLRKMSIIFHLPIAGQKIWTQNGHEKGAQFKFKIGLRQLAGPVWFFLNQHWLQRYPGHYLQMVMFT